MDRNSIVVIFVLSVISFACSSSSEKSSDIKFTFKDFPKKEVLKGEIYTYPEILVPSRILYKKNKLIVSDRSGLAILHRIDVNSMKYETEMGQIGWGPGELSGVWSLDPGVEDDTFWVYSSTGKLFAEYNLLDSSKLFLNSIKQAENWYLATKLRILNKNAFLGNMVNGEDQFVVFDSLGNALKSYGKWAEVMPELSYNTFLIADLYQGDLIGNPKNGIYILPSINVDRIEILDVINNTKKVIIGPLNHKPDYIISNSAGYEVILLDRGSRMTVYNTGYVSDNMIFLAYIGKTDKQRRNGDSVKDIFVLDFDGKPIVHYELDISILNLTVDEENRKIYGTTQGEEPGIVVFDF